jgi:hypothetical protein
MKTLTIIVVLSLTSCMGISKITVAGQYGDYSFTPRRTIIIESEK